MGSQMVRHFLYSSCLIMTDLRYSTGEELEQFLYDKCRQDPDLLATIINEYVCSLSDNKLIELEDFLTNNFGDEE
jgi:hypothetical protein